MSQLIVTKPEKINRIFLETLKRYNKNAIVVLDSKPFMILRKDLSKCRTKTRECVFIDTVEGVENEEAIYIPSSNLTALSIAINQALQPLGKAMVIFNSIASLTVNNSPEVLIRFFSFILSKSKDWGSEVVIIVSAEDDQKVVSMLKQFVDEVKTR